MKSSFLFVMMWALLMNLSLAQQDVGRPAKKPRKITPPSSLQESQTPTTQRLHATPTEEKTHFERFWQRISISYFGILASPNLKDRKSRNAAVSPQWSQDFGGRCRGVCDQYPAFIWSQVAFVYNYGGTMSFSLVPRWSQWLGSPRSEPTAPNGDLVYFEDTLLAVQGVVYQSPNKAVDWWIRPAIRLPMMRTTRLESRPEFGTVTQNVELLGFLTWHINPTWELGLLHQQRVWVYEDRYNLSRVQHYTAPFLWYKLDDKTKIQLFYEHILRHGNAPSAGFPGGPTAAGGPWHSRMFWNAVMVGVARDITPKFNLYPYLTTFVDHPRGIGPHAMFIGAWIQYQFK
jgi:hypothetical protein